LGVQDEIARPETSSRGREVMKDNQADFTLGAGEPAISGLLPGITHKCVAQSQKYAEKEMNGMAKANAEKRVPATRARRINHGFEAPALQSLKF